MYEIFIKKSWTPPLSLPLTFPQSLQAISPETAKHTQKHTDALKYGFHKIPARLFTNIIPITTASYETHIASAGKVLELYHFLWSGKQHLKLNPPEQSEITKIKIIYVYNLCIKMFLKAWSGSIDFRCVRNEDPEIVRGICVLPRPTFCDAPRAVLKPAGIEEALTGRCSFAGKNGFFNFQADPSGNKLWQSQIYIYTYI